MTNKRNLHSLKPSKNTKFDILYVWRVEKVLFSLERIAFTITWTPSRSLFSAVDFVCHNKDVLVQHMNNGNICYIIFQRKIIFQCYLLQRLILTFDITAFIAFFSFIDFWWFPGSKMSSQHRNMNESNESLIGRFHMNSVSKPL